MNKSLRQESGKGSVKRDLRLALLASESGFLVLAAGPSFAQDKPGATSKDEDSGADIIVTASRREETLSRVPISIAAYSQEVLDKKGIRSADDLVRFTTGVNLLQNSPVRGFAIAIRGVDSRVGASTVGIYIDETPIQVRRLGAGSFATNIYPQIFDLDRIEVLRGPQGTLFGAGSEGGTIRFITPEPGFDGYSYSARAEIANTKNGEVSYDGGVALGGPLVEDVLAFRASASYRRDGGWIDRIDPDTDTLVEADTNHTETLAVRGALSYRPADTVTITPSVMYQRRKINNSNQFWDKRSLVPGVLGVPQPSIFYTVPFSDRRHGQFYSGDPLAQPGVEKFVLASVKAEVELGGVTATANGSYFKSDAVFRFDFSTPTAAVVTQGAVVRIPGFVGYNDDNDRQRNWTGELRLQPTEPGERWNWLAGIFYTHNKQGAIAGISGNTNDFLFRSLTGNPNITAEAILGAPNYQPGDYALYGTNIVVDKQLAGFAEVNYNVTPELKLTAGARYSHVEANFAAFSTGPFAGPTQSSASTSTSNPITPKFNISYQPDPQNLFYATAAKGFRVGGGNSPLPGALCGAAAAAIGLSTTPASYGPDSLWSYEIGSKNKLLNNRLQIDASVYNIEWRRLQQQVFLPCQFFFVANAGKARSQGFDLQLTMRPTDRFTFGAAVGYNKARYTETVYPGPVAGTGPGSVIFSKGDAIDNPPWTVVLNGRYEAPIGDKTLYLAGDYTYRSRNKKQSPVQNPLSVAFEGYPTIEEYTQLNLRAGLTLGSIDVSAFVNNLTDTAPLLYYRQDYPGSGLHKNASTRPRTIGLTVSFKQ